MDKQAALAPRAKDLADEVPLAIDLDGTILVNDSLLECLFALARRRPLAMLQLPIFWLKGRARLKQAMAAQAGLDIATLPMRAELLLLMREQHRRGRRLLLVTGADRLIARAVAERLPLFEEVMASDGRVNLSGAVKRDRLLARFGPRGFDYVGNGRADLPVWAAARQAWVLSSANSLAAAAARVSTLAHQLQADGPSLACYIKAIRVHHWPKNLLVLAPLLLAQRLHESAQLSAGLLAMLCFSLVASSVYLLNDLLDLQADRHHPQKKQRALASGKLPISRALWLLPCLWLSAAGLAQVLPSGFLALLAGYFALMLGYCLWLKDLPIIDTLVLAFGYTLRIQAGALVLRLGAAPLLLVSCGALFFGLALLKRYAELLGLAAAPPGPAQARAYRPGDAQVIAELGITASCIGVALLAGFASSPVFLLPARLPWASWLFCTLLMLWLGHMWLMAHRGRILDDPVAFALRDGFSRVVAAMMLVVLAAGAWAGRS
ncbi:UbiA family prenyltransferase [Roseateles oligotrophus]|uniref:UbiA family prenyltransferase n=1 Tax=Roseateles oligotrophus TaxID=1769250 RepID=A0ABT2YMM5_9BURK|nr:UbiA family prenyltransferase [Roseateles oligotrophus]MCV2371308.1 UbiA family prenyltransferase [Roseateles oligotrophus]